MGKKVKSIPVNSMLDGTGAGIVIENFSFTDLPAVAITVPENVEETTQVHRHDSHSFFLLQSGTVVIEIDFQKYRIKAPSLIYIHPNQVHRTSVSKNVVVSSLAINNENLNPEYLGLLEGLVPAKPLTLEKDTFSIFCEAVSLCTKFFDRKGDKLYHALLKDSCNALVALALSQYLAQDKSPKKVSRFDVVTKAFKEALERNYTIAKRPADYALQLNLSTPYLNECVKGATGYSVSYHIQQRIVLEAKRLLYHSGKSVKEIADLLGYDDYPYFSRLFTKTTGMTALAFRSKNLD